MFAGFSDIQNLTGGIPWLSSGYDSVLSLPGPRFVPWSGKIAQAVQCGQKTNKTPHGIILMLFFVVVVQSLNCVPLFATSWTAEGQVFLSFTISRRLLTLMSVESVVPSTRLILCHPVLLLPSVFPSIRVFSNELALYIRWPKYWSFSFSISPSSEYSGLISFSIDWFDLLAVQGTLKSLLKHHSSKASVLQC